MAAQSKHEAIAIWGHCTGLIQTVCKLLQFLRLFTMLHVQYLRSCARIGILALASMAGAAVWSQSLAIYTELVTPNQIRLPNGELGGPVIELVRELQRRVGNTDTIKVVPWSRGYHLLSAEPNTLLFAIARTAERNALFHWVGPVDEDLYGLYVKTDSAINLKSLEDAKSLKFISVYRDDVRDQILTKAGFTNLDRTSDSSASIKKLMAGRVDAISSSVVTIDGLMAAAGTPRDSVRLALTFLAAQTWLAFSKGTSEKTVADWNEAFESMKKDKSFEAIMKAGNPRWAPPAKAITQF